MTRWLDVIVTWLMRPRVRHVRRWAFLFTLPAAALVAYLYGVQHGAAVLVGRVLLWALIAMAAWRMAGERGEALRDLLMHPRARAFCRAEFDVLTALPRLIVVLAMRRRQQGTAYHCGTFGPALALAFTPPVVAEGVALHLLAGGWIAWVLSAGHAYMLMWLWGFVLGPRAYPHRVGARTAVLRAGPLYRVAMPRSAVLTVTSRRVRVDAYVSRAIEQEDAVLLAVRGRVDVWLEFTEPVLVQRPLREPLPTRRLAVASDDPDLLVRRLAAAPGCDRARERSGTPLAVVDLASIARDTLQPG